MYSINWWDLSSRLSLYQFSPYRSNRTCANICNQFGVYKYKRKLTTEWYLHTVQFSVLWKYKYSIGSKFLCQNWYKDFQMIEHCINVWHHCIYIMKFIHAPMIIVSRTFKEVMICIRKMVIPFVTVGGVWQVLVEKCQSSNVSGIISYLTMYNVPTIKNLEIHCIWYNTTPTKITF